MFDVRAINLEETIKAIRQVDKGLAKEIKREIREVAKPSLPKARAYAGGLGSNPSGQYAGSLSLKTRPNGVAFISKDPGGGVIEFANIGAVVLHGPRKGQRCPVPHGSNPPRALLRAILEDEDEIIRGLNDRLADYIDSEVHVG